MQRFLGKYTDITYSLMRFVAGLLFFFHGTQKLFGWPGAKETVELMSLRGLAGVIEVVAGTLIAIGLWAAPAAFIASGQMAFAYFMVHAPQSIHPILNRGELAALYCFVFLYIASRGSGRFSIDGARGKGNRKKR
jgi:putative oxidoreductase